MQSGGFRLSEDMIDAAIEAGLRGLGVSIDGLEATHDGLRGREGSFAEAFRVLRHAARRRLPTSVNTQITAPAIPELPALMRELVSAGVKWWQVQLTVAMGNAADNDGILLQPYELATLMPLIARLHRDSRRRGLMLLMLLPGNNLGYFGPYAALWRGPGHDAYRGCAAGRNVLGLEADGTVKGCPSLPRSRYEAGNVRDRPLAELWHDGKALRRNRTRRADELWGFCRGCIHAADCRGGCTWTADALFGRGGNNPYCHHRVLALAERGLRERVIKVEDAPKTPFATGRFALIEEPA
jgi:radical SAM protein with 4Fe4S-binding SPASM domain